ncbi:MAG: fumarylacetoacetate hydrolase family protein [Acidobacteria bacterium]|jgi:2-keto-4-pentenoate hydratase/2-oxohepta-3-ene-1,7-dioic acid hydratase in catechol pathway|nr:fumarylacetoacetate hydrolase family protein [Acidobacteriota bacterium]
MKIIRFLTEANNICYGVVSSQEDEKANLIKGNIFETFSITSGQAVVKKILSPVIPPNIIGIGLNYAKHADETGIRYPEIPVMFLKGVNSVIGHLDAIILPKAGPNEVDYEAELAIIIGKTARNVPVSDAMNYVLGYCCANDVSARDWQIKKQKTQWCRGKSFDTFCPLGPYLVTADEIPNPNHLDIQAEINGNIFQKSNTADMIFDVPTLISDLSQSMTMLPGTVILTGTPEGVGFTRKPPVFLKEGDRVTISIEKLGCLTNPVISEEA